MMSTANASTPEPGDDVCASCGAALAGEYCHACGQHRRGSRRLVVREVLSRFCEHLLDFDSSFARTFAGLLRRPGETCREYVAGRRKRYMNPFGYLLLAGTASLVISALLEWLFGTRDPAGGGEPGAGLLNWVLLALLVPLAAIWSWMFRSCGFNLAENYVFALFVMGQFTWLELLILVPAEFVVPEGALIAVYLLVWTGYLTFAATGFYRQQWWLVLAKMLITHAVLIFMAMIVGVVWFLIAPSEPAA
jgi:hypothetical protein